MERLVFATWVFLKDCSTNGTDVEFVCAVGVVNNDLAMGEDLFLVSANKVYFVDPVGTGTHLMVTAPGNIRDIRYNPTDKNLYYLTSSGQPAVFGFNPTEKPVNVFSIRTSGAPEHLAVNVDENELIYNIGTNLYRYDIDEKKEELITASFPSVSALVAYKNKIYDVRDGMVETRRLDGSIITSFPAPAATRLEVFGEC
ncbi:uncharacterized protein [Haliotis asinina]|uniref:uncharacterized protein n=1 Tax=Haliotis asinina TaxID=109174 RepID=UPI003531E8F6